MDAIPFNFNLATALAILVSVVGSLIVSVYNFGKLKQRFDSMDKQEQKSDQLTPKFIDHLLEDDRS